MEKLLWESKKSELYPVENKKNTKNYMHKDNIKRLKMKSDFS